jgi:hypothetical protein
MSCFLELHQLCCVFLIYFFDFHIEIYNENDMGRVCSKTGEKRNTFGLLVGKPEENRPVRRPRRRWVDNIDISLKDRMG